MTRPKTDLSQWMTLITSMLIRNRAMSACPKSRHPAQKLGINRMLPLPSQHASSRRVVLLLLCLSMIACTRSNAQITVDFSSSAPSPQTRKGMTVEDVIRLSKAGLSDYLIIEQIRKKGQRFDLSTDQLVQLKAASISERVIQVRSEERPGGK